MINYGNEIGSGASNGNNTLNHIKESRENVFRYLQRITDEFRTPVYGGTETRNAVSISTAEELVQKLRENPNGFYVLEKDISMKGIQASGEVYVDTTSSGNWMAMDIRSQMQQCHFCAEQPIRTLLI